MMRADSVWTVSLSLGYLALASKSALSRFTVNRSRATQILSAKLEKPKNLLTRTVAYFHLHIDNFQTADAQLVGTTFLSLYRQRHLVVVSTSVILACHRERLPSSLNRILSLISDMQTVPVQIGSGPTIFSESVFVSR